MPISPDNFSYQGYVDDSIPPIDRLTPNSSHHQWVLEQILNRIKCSEDEMSKFYPRYRVNERKVQAYMNLPRFEQILKDMNDSGKPPAPAIIVFPYQYAVLATIVTYLMRVFLGRKPIFQLGSTSPESANAVRHMETMLQYQADYTRLISRLYQFFMDGELYGLSVMRNTWVQKRAMRTSWRPLSPAESLISGYKSNPSGMTRVRSEKLIYEGAEIENIDPFMFFPDPTVPMAEVSTKGEYVFWREFLGKHLLLAEEAQGNLKYIDSAEPFRGGADGQWLDLSNRNLLSGGTAHAGQSNRYKKSVENVYMVDQGVVTIIPDSWGLGDETYPQRFLFTILNKSQIVQAEPLDNDHDEAPIVVSEPYSMGYGFGNPSIADYLGPIQDIMSWFIDSHIYNVRSALANQFIVDPSKVEMQDVKNPQPGKIIRLKPTAIGTDVRAAIQQLQVSDVTRGHMVDLQIFQRIGDTVSAVNENMRGVQKEGGRKTATEVRVSGEGAASRLAAHAQLYSDQAISRLARQMSLNTQQYLSQEIWLRVVGQENLSKIGPLNLMSEFTFPTHDGTLPLDRAVALEGWKELFLAVKGDQELRTTYSLPKIFEFLAGLGGAQNISSFKTNIAPGGVGGPPPGNISLPDAAAQLAQQPQPGGARQSLPPPRFNLRMSPGVPVGAKG